MSAPKAPDPAATSAAQAKANKDTAVTEYGLNATNQVTPEGSLTYKQIGTWEDGTPRFEATTAYNPEQQALFDLNTQTQQRVGQIGYDQAGRVGDILGTPVNLDNDAVEGRLFDLATKRLTPEFDRKRSSIEVDLLNKGIRPGSQAYQEAMDALGRQENDALNQITLQGRGQSVSEILAGRNQPINEITALMSGSQVSQPQFAQTPSPGVAPTDVTGPIMAKYQADNANYQAKMGGIFGLASAPLGGWAYNGFKLPKAA